MSMIDIRQVEDSLINRIQFADAFNSIESDSISKNEGGVFIESDEYECMKLATKQDAENLIKALQKAIELGWWQDKPAGVSE